MSRRKAGGRELTWKQEQQIRRPETIEEIYEKVRRGELKQFPKETFSDQDNLSRIVKSLINDVLEMEEQEIPQKIKNRHFINNKLNGMIQNKYDGSSRKAIMDTYKTLPWDGNDVELKPYYFKTVPQNTWVDKEGNKNYTLAKEATRELIEILMEYEGWKLEDIPKNIEQEHFYEHRLPFNANLKGMLGIVYNNTPAAAVIDACPVMEWKGKIIELKLYHFHGGHHWTNKKGWKNMELAREGVRELVQILTSKGEPYKWKLEEVPEKISSMHFEMDLLPFNANLAGPLNYIYDWSPQKALKDACPELYVA